MITPPRHPVPWQLGVPGCGAMPPTGHHGKPELCRGSLAWVGLRLIPARYGRLAEAWLAGVCEEHRERAGLVGERRPLVRDRARLASWESSGVVPRPLAVGVDAVALVERARRWARS